MHRDVIGLLSQKVGATPLEVSHPAETSRPPLNSTDFPVGAARRRVPLAEAAPMMDGHSDEDRGECTTRLCPRPFKGQKVLLQPWEQ